MSSSNTRMTKAERRDAAREKARQLRAEQVKREKRNKMLVIAGVVAFLVVVAIAVYSIVSAGTQPEIEQVETVPANTSVEDGGISLGESLTAGTTNEGAPVISVYQDYTCVYCSQFEELNGEDVVELVESGEATFVVHPIALLDRSGNFSAYSGRATHAAAVVADQAPEQFLAANEALFDLYDEARDAGGEEPGAAEIRQALTDAGIPEEVAVEATPEEIAEGTFYDWVQATTEQASQDGISGTPTVYVEGEVFEGWTEEGALAEAVRSS